MNQPDSAPTPEPVAPVAPPRALAGGAGFGLAILTALLSAQLCVGWMHGRMLNRQHAQLMELREDLQYLAEAIEHSYSDGDVEEGQLAPAHRKGRREGPYALRSPFPAGRQSGLLRVRARIQEDPPPEQDRAAKELEAARQSGEKAVKDARVAQEKLSIKHAAERAERDKEIETASKGFLWATIGAAAVLFGAFAARGFIRRQRG